MPIIIDEIVISVNVDNNAGTDSAGISMMGKPQDPNTKQAIVQECVEQVMEILKERNEP